MAMPSVTVMVQNSRGVPPAGGDALLHGLRLAHQRDVAGRGFVPAGGDADERLVDLRRGQAHGVVIGAVRGALGTLGHVPAGQPGLELGLGVHRRSGPPGPSAAIPPRELACGLLSLGPALPDPAGKNRKCRNGLRTRIRSHGMVWPNSGAMAGNGRCHSNVPVMLRAGHSLTIAPQHALIGWRRAGSIS